MEREIWTEPGFAFCTKCGVMGVTFCYFSLYDLLSFLLARMESEVIMALEMAWRPWLTFAAEMDRQQVTSARAIVIIGSLN
jgi:hypothetical protein